MIGFIQRIRAYFSDSEHARFRQIFLLLLIVTALPLIIIAAQQEQTLRQRAGGGGVLLTLSPTSGTAQVGEPLSVDVILQASSNNITGVDVSVQFNDAILSVNKFVPGTQFNAEVVNRVDPATSTFRYVATSTDPTAQITGDIKLGTLVLEPKTAGQGTLNFQSSQVTALGNPDGLSVSSENGSYVVSTPVSPTVEPTATPSATPTATLAPSPIASPTPTPIVPSPTATPIPTNTPVPPTATPTPVPVAGDANGDGIVNILDYNIWRDEFLGIVSTNTSDFNRDGKIDLLDFNIWRTAFNSSSPTSAPTAIPTNTPVPPTATPAVVGFGKAFQTGANTYIKIPFKIPNLPFADGRGLAISFWVKPLALSNDGNPRYLVSREIVESGIQGFDLGVTNRQVEFTIAIKAPSGEIKNGYVASTTLLDFNRWYHIVGEYDGTQVRLFINGAREGVQQISGTRYDTTTSTSVTVGCKLLSANFCLNAFNGQIDDVVLDSGALYFLSFSPPKSPASVSTGSTIGIYNLNGNAQDSSTRGNNGETVGNVQFVDSTVPTQ